jgi:casein kinase II subunit alpha
LVRIAKVMGTDDLHAYVKKYKINIPPAIAKILKSYPAQDLEEFINKNNQ